MIRFSLLIILICSLVQSAFANNSFLVAPTHWDVDLTRPNTQEYILTNTGDDRIHIKITPLFLHPNSSSLNLGSDLNKKLADQGNIARYLLISPRALSLMPGEKRIVRVSIHVPQHLASGEYRAHLLFHMINPFFNVYSRAKDGSQRTVKMNLNMLLEMATSITGHIGSGQPHITLSCKHDQDGAMLLTFRNDQPWRFIGQLSVRNSQHKLVAQNNIFIMLRDTKETLKFPIKAHGRYTINWQDRDNHYAGHGHCQL